METVNIVATGSLNFDELDIKQLYRDVGEDIARLKPGRLDIEFGENSPLIMVYPAGTYTIPGAASISELDNVRERFINFLKDVSGGRLSERSFSIKYKVFMSDFANQIDLETLALALGLENVEYEPEQFPGLIYRVDNPDGVVLVFSSGKMLFTGFEDETDAKVVEDELQEIIAV